MAETPPRTVSEWERITRLFDAARSLEPAERAAFLAASCGGNEAARAEVESLLDHDRADAFLTEPAAALSQALAESVTQPEAGQLLHNRYRLEARMATGGQALVYRATDEALSRPVVVKLLRAEGREQEPLRARLRHEVEALARLDHPGVVGILDAGELADGSPFLVIQFVEGQSLREALNRGPFDRARAAAILRQAGSALSAAHAAGITHRDLKPENIMLQRLSDGAESVKLIDFGIAKIERSELDPHTTTVMIAGTIRYMAPEQFHGENGPASDLYSLALITCEMLSGHADPRALPRTIDGKVRSHLEAGLAFRSEDRPASIRRWSNDLAEALESQTRRRLLAAAGAAAVFLGGAGFVGGSRYNAARNVPRVIEYTAAFDPVAEGFQVHNDLVGTIAPNRERTGYDGWRVTTTRQGDYYHHLSDRQQRLALDRGWKLSATMRAEEGASYVTVDFAGRGNWFAVNVEASPTMDLVLLCTQIVPHLGGLEFRIARTEPVYRSYELVYDPGLRSAALWIDGAKVLSGYAGHTQFQEGWGFSFGATLYGSQRGIGTFQQVRFEINP